MNTTSARALSVIAVAVAALGSTAVWAADSGGYPTKPIRMLVGFAPGGGTDTTARALTPKLAERFGQQVIVDNRPGAAGNIATDITTKAPPDGYTILMGTIAALAINPTLYGNLPFDPLKDLAPVTQAVDSTNLLVVHPTVQAKTVKELIALAKKQSLNGGSSGVGGAGHLALELFNVMAGTKITHVPYKGGGPAMVDLLGGQINLIFATAASAVGHVKSGKIRALAVTGASRHPSYPDVPTVKELGYDVEYYLWIGYFAPRNTPAPVVKVLRDAFRQTVEDPAFRSAMEKINTPIAYQDADEFRPWWDADSARLEGVIRRIGRLE